MRIAGTFFDSTSRVLRFYLNRDRILQSFCLRNFRAAGCEARTDTPENVYKNGVGGMRLRARWLVAVLVVAAVACGGGGSSPTTPSPAPSPTPTPTPAPTPTTVSLTGVVTAQSGSRLLGATVTILDGANAGRSAKTNYSGDYRFDRLVSDNANLAAVASSYEEFRSGVFINGTNTLNFTLRTLRPWMQRGGATRLSQCPPTSPVC